MNLRQQCIVIGLLFVLMTFFGSNAISQKIEFKDGIRIVQNDKPLWGDEPKVKLEFVRQIGEFDSADENFLFFYPFDLDIDSDGNIYILDSGNHRILKYNSEGEYLQTLGGRGQGPSEFEYAENMFINKNDDIFLYDVTRKTLMILDKNGEELFRQIFIRHLNGGFELQSNGLIITSESGYRKLEKTGDHLMLILNKKCEIQRVFGEATDFKDGELKDMANWVGFTVDSEDNIYIAYKFQNRIDKYSPDGEMILSFNRNLPYNVTSKAEYNTANFHDGPRKVLWMNFISEGIAVDGKGRIWVITHAEQPDKKTYVNKLKLEIFNKDGILLGEMLVDQIFDRLKIFGDRIFLGDAWEEMMWREYKIVEL
jgi:hypothetical protein